MSTNKTALDLALEKLDRTFTHIEGDRASLIDKMRSIVNRLDIDPNSDAPRMIETKLQIINAFDGLLKSAEGSAVAATKVQMQKRSEENSEASRQLVIEMLKNINVMQGHNTGSGVAIPSTMVKEVEKACEETKHPISDDELTMPDVTLEE